MTTLKELRRRTGGLGRPSKMPGLSYGLPAEACLLGSVLARLEGTPCSGCYALKGNYMYPSVRAAQARRLAAPEDLETWRSDMVALIRRELSPAVRVFRWHDSGDLQSVAHLEAIVWIARALPDVRFWLPTQERGIVGEWIDAGGVVPRNLRIRVSSVKRGKRGAIPRSWRRRGIATSSVGLGDGFTCRAPEQGNECRDCRACWDPVAHVDYRPH